MDAEEIAVETITNLGLAHRLVTHRLFRSGRPESVGVRIDKVEEDRDGRGTKQSAERCVELLRNRPAYQQACSRRNARA